MIDFLGRWEEVIDLPRLSFDIAVTSYLIILGSYNWNLFVVALDDDAIKHGEIEIATKTVVYS
jgi:hypothetical protein